MQILDQIILTDNEVITINLKDRFEACLLYGAVGDAVGYQIEFSSLSEIKRSYGEKGLLSPIIDYYSGKMLISDDTQMTIFTAVGILEYTKRMRSIDSKCSVKDGCFTIPCGAQPTFRTTMVKAYRQWLKTQTIEFIPTKASGMFKLDADIIGLDQIMKVKELYAERAPGMTCTSALQNAKIGRIERPINDSKGCGGVMRVAPVGMYYYKNPEDAFDYACEAAAITHGNPTGYLSAGAFAMLIATILNGKNLEDGIQDVLKYLKKYPSNDETYNSIQKAYTLMMRDSEPEKGVEQLGEGWVAEEALSIALYCALKEKDPIKALILAVNHNGDSDSTGAICGNILGAMYGNNMLPSDWIENLELSDVIKIVADGLHSSSQL